MKIFTALLWLLVLQMAKGTFLAKSSLLFLRKVLTVFEIAAFKSNWCKRLTTICYTFNLPITKLRNTYHCLLYITTVTCTLLTRNLCKQSSAFNCYHNLHSVLSCLVKLCQAHLRLYCVRWSNNSSMEYVNSFHFPPRKIIVNMHPNK